MAQAVIETSKSLPYAPGDLCRMVGDVRAYPKFVPWLTSLRILKEKPLEDGGWEGVAQAQVGWKALNETFATRVRSAPLEGVVDVALVSGPFKSLETRWRFLSKNGGGSDVEIWLAYEFKNPVLQAIASANRQKVSERMVKAFEAEAHKRFGGENI